EEGMLATLVCRPVAEEKKSKGGVASTLRGFDEMENKVGLSQISTKTRDDVVPHPLSVALVHDDYLVGPSDDEIETKGVGSGGYARTPSPEGDSEGSKAVEVKYEEARSTSIVSDKEGISQIFGEVKTNWNSVRRETFDPLRGSL
ncbi:hypothetical protein U1Q18_040517, partial [Sarracenia purpurea var. burkii]